MKKLLFFIMLSVIGLTAQAYDVVKAGVRYDITTTGQVDIEYDTEEVVPDGKMVVVFYYTDDPSHPFLFGKNYKSPSYKNEEGYVRQWCTLAHSKNANGSEHLNIYGYVTAGEYWYYKICDAAEVESISPEVEDETPAPVVVGNGGTVSASCVYALPLSDEEGYVADNTVVMSEPSTASQYIVVFLNAPTATNSTLDFRNIFYNAAGNKGYTQSGGVTKSNDGTFSYRRYYWAGAQSKIDVYAQDMDGDQYDDGYTWCYVIVNSLDEVSTVANPAEKGGGSTTPQQKVPGQDVENAILLTANTNTSFTPYNDGGRNLTYFKLVPANSGTVTMNISAATSFARWMEDGVMAYGQLKQNMFANGNQFVVEKGKTYYCYYTFADAASSTASYSLQVAEPGAARGEAILLTANSKHDLLGIPMKTVNGDKVYENKTTWFKVAKQGALKANDLVTVKLDGGVNGEIALLVNDDNSSVKSYGIGDGAGLLPINSTVQFDLNLAENDYYIAITQDNVGGQATFTFKTAAPGESIGKAITAVVGSNSVSKSNTWYVYTHSGADKLIKISGVNTVYNENQGMVAEGADITAGFVIKEGESIYFQANTIGFTITLAAVDKGVTPEDPVIINNDDEFTFRMTGGSGNDAFRYMQYTATEDGTYMYATDNAKVIEYANGASVRDVTNPESPKAISIVQEESDEFGETYFIYKWTVLAGHTYLIEQGLGSNYGTVNFFPLFEPAEEGQTIGKASAIGLNETKDLGRTASTTYFYKFVAPEAGDYTVSVQLVGYVKSYDAEGAATTIAKNYSDGMEYHNETFSLAAGESLVFSVEASQTIEHVAGGVNDDFIPNYYAIVTKANVLSGIDYTKPIACLTNTKIDFCEYNTWRSITVPAGETVTVDATLTSGSDVNSIYFAAPDTYGKMTWANKNTDLLVSTNGNKQSFTLSSSTTDRVVMIMAYGMHCSGSYIVTVSGQEVVVDVDNNGKLEKSDIDALVNIILEKGDASHTPLDLNSDGKVSVSDVNTIIKKVLDEK